MEINADPFSLQIEAIFIFSRWLRLVVTTASYADSLKGECSSKILWNESVPSNVTYSLSWRIFLIIIYTSRPLESELLRKKLPLRWLRSEILLLSIRESRFNPLNARFLATSKPATSNPITSTLAFAYNFNAPVPITPMYRDHLSVTSGVISLKPLLVLLLSGICCCTLNKC